MKEASATGSAKDARVSTDRATWEAAKAAAKKADRTRPVKE